MTRERSCYNIGKQEHAFAGALAGVFVSLCLHPVDTIKTVFQSYHAEQKSLSYIGKSIVTDRGGLVDSVFIRSLICKSRTLIFLFVKKSSENQLHC